MNVIRRPARQRVEIVAAPAQTPRVEVPKIVLTPAEERDRMMRDRDRRIRGEVEAEFRAVGAKVFLNDPIKGARDEYRCKEVS